MYPPAVASVRASGCGCLSVSRLPAERLGNRHSHHLEKVVGSACPFRFPSLFTRRRDVDGHFYSCAGICLSGLSRISLPACFPLCGLRLLRGCSESRGRGSVVRRPLCLGGDSPRPHMVGDPVPVRWNRGLRCGGRLLENRVCGKGL